MKTSTLKNVLKKYNAGIKSCGLALMTFAAVNVSAQDFIVNTTNDTQASNPATNALDASGNISLRSALQSSTARTGNHTITFNSSVATAGVINLSLGTITVGSTTGGTNITINGPGMTIFTVNQTTAAKIFSTGTGAITFTLQNMTLNYTGPAPVGTANTFSTGGFALVAGGAGAVTNLTNCRFTNFRNQIGNGGAVSVSSANASHTLTVSNCVFSNNACGGAGGGLNYSGIGTCTITGTTFSNDSTGAIGTNIGGGGGALSVSGAGSGGTYSVSTCTFIGNTIKEAGAIINTNGTLTLQYNRFLGNTAATASFGNTIAQDAGGTTVANDNWWGINTGPGTNDAVAFSTGTITKATWLQLRNIPAATALCPNGSGTSTTVVTADILGRNTGGPIAASNLTGLAAFPTPAATIFSSPVLGTLSAAQTQFTNGVATVTYNAGTIGGNGLVTATADNQPVTTANIVIPSAPVISPVSTTVCQGSAGNVVNGPAGASTYAWTITNGTITSAANIQNITYSAGSVSPVTVSLTITTSGGCTLSNSANITANISNTLSGTSGGAQVCGNYAVAAGGTTYTDGSCNPIARVVPSGVLQVSGTVNTCVKIDASVQVYNTQPYVQRHYDITPATGAATATGTITLYFTQTEFTAYNTARGVYPPLPTGPADATGIANLKVTQYHGTGTTPGNYTGPAELINPVDANIVWNSTASRWEVTFDVVGFSGFYVSTGNYAVPLTLLNFSGRNAAAQNFLEWTTAQERNSSYFEIQRSEDGNNFTKMGIVLATGNSSSNISYRYTDNVANAATPVYYYRLKMVDMDGKFVYSPVVKLRSDKKSGFAVEVSPNPFRQQLRASIESAQNDEATLRITDASGKVLVQQKVILKKGTNVIDLNEVSRFTAGIYTLSVATSQDKQSFKVVKE